MRVLHLLVVAAFTQCVMPLYVVAPLPPSEQPTIIAERLFRSGDCSGAERELNRERGTARVSYWYFLAAGIAQCLQKNEDALGYLNKLQKIDPSSGLAQAATKRIEALEKIVAREKTPTPNIAGVWDDTFAKIELRQRGDSVFGFQNGEQVIASTFDPYKRMMYGTWIRTISTSVPEQCQAAAAKRVTEHWAGTLEEGSRSMRLEFRQVVMIYAMDPVSNQMSCSVREEPREMPTRKGVLTRATVAP